MKRMRTTIEECRSIAANHNAICLAEECLGQAIKMPWKCEKGHVFYMRVHNIKHSNQWCPQCFNEKQNEKFVKSRAERNVNDLYKCMNCKYYKEINNFNKDKNDIFGIARFCKECSNKSSREHGRKIEKSNKELLIKIKNVCCLDCHNKFPYYAMHFDHINDDKLYNVGAMLSHNEKKILKEIAKCEIVCANCHFIRTFNRKNGAVPKSLFVQRNQKYVNNIKSISPCVDCKLKFHFYAMQFDHIDATNKKTEVSRLVNSNCDIITIQNEIDKCDLVCANCHAIRTYIRRDI